MKRLGEVVVQQRPRLTAVWRAFLVAQAAVQQSARRREMTTQRIFLTGQREH